MLAPDIFKISLSKDNIHFSTSQFDSKIIRNDISNHYFNHGVIAVIPGKSELPCVLKESLLHDSEYYLFPEFPIYNFVDYTFIEAFVRQGEVTALSDKTMLDVENCCCMTPSGYLVLSLQRNYFLEVGIEQGPAVTIKAIDNRYLIYIDLKHDSFNPKKKNFQRVLNQLKKVNLRMDMIVHWEPGEQHICPSSIASYFHTKGIVCYECQLNYEEKKVYEVMLPKFETSHFELFEWLGIHVHVLEGSDVADEATQEYLSTYQLPDDSKVVGCVYTLQWTGLMTSKRILKLLDTMRRYISTQSSIPWMALHIHGFEDSPISWNLQPHKFTTRGDNNYTFIFNQTEKVKICKSFTSLKSIF